MSRIRLGDRDMSIPCPLLFDQDSRPFSSPFHGIFANHSLSRDDDYFQSQHRAEGAQVFGVVAIDPL